MKQNPYYSVASKHLILCLAIHDSTKPRRLISLRSGWRLPHALWAAVFLFVMLTVASFSSQAATPVHDKSAVAQSTASLLVGVEAKPAVRQSGPLPANEQKVNDKAAIVQNAAPQAADAKPAIRQSGPLPASEQKAYGKATAAHSVAPLCPDAKPVASQSGPLPASEQKAYDKAAVVQNAASQAADAKPVARMGGQLPPGEQKAFDKSTPVRPAN